MNKDRLFTTPIWHEYKIEFLKSLDKASNKYIKDTRKKEKEEIKKNKDFGTSHHSVQLINSNEFLDFRNYVGKKSHEFLIEQGFNMNEHSLAMTEMWVQEFSKNGGGHHSAHIHWNQHVCGFYFLRCNEETSYPIFHDPRTGARATKLPILDDAISNGGEDLINFKPVPGALLFFPGYLEHHFTVDHGKHPFRFIHFTLQAFPKQIFNNEN